MSTMEREQPSEEGIIAKNPGGFLVGFLLGADVPLLPPRPYRVSY
jgi:hypothetical protein